MIQTYKYIWNQAKVKFKLSHDTSLTMGFYKEDFPRPPLGWRAAAGTSPLTAAYPNPAGTACVQWEREILQSPSVRACLEHVEFGDDALEQQRGAEQSVASSS